MTKIRRCVYLTRDDDFFAEQTGNFSEFVREAIQKYRRGEAQ